ncbi:MAG TPA: exopolysaccharide biosynthesis polyprenyl glycosylphosphotransferase [Gemmatimonadaceae bacterium]|nr:exopolysaccharide biosynthesis polyprenyl glycosylphosphotransferase [Gemmatimonadaceae bacterium]
MTATPYLINSGSTLATSVTLRGPSSYSPPSVGLQRDALPWRNTAALTLLALVAADIVALLVARQLALQLRTWVFGPMAMSPAFFAASVLWISMRAVSGLYPGYGIPQPEELRRSTVTTALAALCHLSLLFSLQMSSASRLIALTTWVMLTPSAWLLRNLVTHLLVRARRYGYPVVILGAGSVATHTIRELRNNRSLGIVPVAAFDDDPAKHGLTVEGVPILGPIEDALTWQPPYAIKNVIVAVPGAGRIVQLAHKLGQRYANVGVVADVGGVGNLWTRSKTVGTCSMVEMRHERFDRINLVLKRAFDLAVGTPLFLLSIPVIAVSALLVKIVSPKGPAFFTQSREAMNGRRMWMWKIRTMVPNADSALREYLDGNRSAREQWERHMKLERDPRIIRGIGHFLRRSSLDELPQLWNVVKGDMSLVGPRPFPGYHLNRFSDDFRNLRGQVPPGITGYWQVTQRSASNLDQQQASDAYYIYNWSLWLDLWIMFRTAGVVLSGRGAY